MNKIIKFSAEWCAPCKHMDQVLEQVKKEIEVEIVHIDIDDSLNADLIEDQEIRSIPTLLCYKDDDLIDRLEGTRSVKQIIDIFTK